MITVVFSTGPMAGRRLEVDQEMIVGRTDCDVTLDEPEVSRRHVVLRPAGAEVEVEDLGSSNGTLVDGQRIAGRVNVRHGSVIRVGTSELVVEVSATQEAQPGAATRIAPTPTPAARPPAVAPPSAGAPVPAAAAAAPAAPSGGLPRWFWLVGGLVEIAVILTAVSLLVYYAVR